MAAQVQKVAFGYANQEVSIDVGVMEGTQFRLLQTLPIADGVGECNYTDTEEFEAMYGSNRLPQDFTDGVLSFEASMTFEKYWVNFIEDVLEDLSIGWSTARFNIGSSLFKGGNVPARQDVLFACKRKSIESSWKKGPEGIMVPIAFTPLNIYRNGRDPVGNTL